MRSLEMLCFCMETDAAAIDPLTATTEYPCEGECREFMDTLRDMSDVSYDLRNGKKLDEDDYDSTLADAMNMDSKPWDTSRSRRCVRKIRRHKSMISLSRHAADSR